MTLREQIKKALEPFVLDGNETLTVTWSSREVLNAREALAALDNPPGFEEWWAKQKRVPLDPATEQGLKNYGRSAFLAGKLSGMPEDLRETLIAALGRDASEAASSLTHHHHGPSEQEWLRKRIEDNADARKWLEEGR